MGVEERIDEVKEKRILFNVDLREKSVVYDETTETDDHRVARVEWTNQTITFNSADKETNAEFKLDWHNPERPMVGFLPQGGRICQHTRRSLKKSLMVILVF